MKKLLLILTILSLSIGVAYAEGPIIEEESDYNGDEGEAGGGSKYLEHGASQYNSGIRIYIVDANGYTVVPDAVDILQQSKPANHIESYSIKVKNRTMSTRWYVDASIPKPFYYDGKFQTNGEAIRNYMLTDAGNGSKNASILIEKYWGADIARRFSQEDWYFCIEPIAWLGVFDGDGYAGYDFYGTATEWARLLYTQHTIKDKNNVEHPMEYANSDVWNVINKTLPNSMILQREQFGFPVPTNAFDRNSNPTIMAEGYGIHIYSAKGMETEEPTSNPEEQEDFTIGTFDPAFGTGNWADLYDIGDGIPVTEKVFNKVKAQEFMTQAKMKKHKSSASNVITFSYTVKEFHYVNKTYTATMKPEEFDDFLEDLKRKYNSNLTYEITMDNPGAKGMRYTIREQEAFYAPKEITKTLTQEFIYYTVLSVDNYTLTNVLVSNGCFPNKLNYTFPDSKVNVNVSKTASVSSNLNQHINLGQFESTQAVDAILTTNQWLTKINNPTIISDTLEINGEVYSGNLRYSKSYGQNKITYVANYKDKITNYTYKEKEYKDMKIPYSVKNGYYGTDLSVTYMNEKGQIKTFSSNYNGSKSNILDGYKQNERIHIITPVISPIAIKGSDVTQLVKENDAVQLRLDETYTLRFSPTMYTNYKNYGYSGLKNNFAEYDLANSLPQGDNPANKYVKYVDVVEVKFPFDVYIDNVLYPQNTWIKTYDKANVKASDSKTWMGLYETTFYVPSFAEELTDEIYVRVTAVNAGNESDEGLNLSDKSQYETNTSGKHSTYFKVMTQTSGWIYDFQVVGTSDTLTYAGFTDYNEQYIAFCPTKEEKKSGVLNRLGETSVRYTLDGSLTNNFNPKNTIALVDGKSPAFSAMGSMQLGTTFSFSLKTISSVLDDYYSDYIKLLPSYRFFLNDGTEVPAGKFDIYYWDGSKYIQMGSQYDKAKLQEVALINKQFTDSYYEDDLDWTVFQYQQNVNSAMDKTAYLNKISKSYCLSEITLNSDMRIINQSALEQLRINQHREPDNLINILNPDEGYTLKDMVSRLELEEYKTKLETSVQTWYGSYYIPPMLYVVDKEKLKDLGYDTVEEYAKDNGLHEESEIWFDDGYLTLSFDIKSYNQGEPHLTYDERLNMFEEEGYIPDGSVKSNGRDLRLPMNPGDIGIIDMSRRVNDNYVTELFMVN